MLAIVLLAGVAVAADAIGTGTVKSIDAGTKKFVLTDAAGKDHTYKFGDKLVINRGGKESQADLKAGDAVDVCYDKGILTWTAHYILVQEGVSKTWVLGEGNVKSYDADTKLLTFTDGAGKTWTFGMGDATVRLDMQLSKVGNVKIGDHALAIVDRVGDKATLRSLMVTRK
jgi:Cu/Ag efflux protein CusF